MPASLPLGRYVRLVRQSGDALLERALGAGIDAEVPTCPRWTVAHLVAHQAMVHRWAAANITGDDPDDVPGQTALRARRDLPEYYADGVTMLVAALEAAPSDLQADVFLADAHDPLTFWARRQAHETLVHAVDARSAELGRRPVADDVDIDTDVACDGVDELLRGFFTRGRSKLFESEPFTISVAPTDTTARWLVHVDERLTVDEGDASAHDAASLRLVGPSASLYLFLWNRGDDVEISGDAAIVQRWQATQRIRWS